ncbi:MAG: flagellar basal body L-ring protein FlgH [Bdellovibrionales bacterium]|nr:flagellar basal body L-ring protein FlgH [Bdellovibrionales bacterium]
MKHSQSTLLVLVVASLSSCMSSEYIQHPRAEAPIIPAKRYADAIQGRSQFQSPPTVVAATSSAVSPLSPEAQARYRFVTNEQQLPYQAEATQQPAYQQEMRAQMGDTVTNMGDAGYEVYPSSQTYTRPYTGPLQLGEPGVSASLWRNAGASTHLFRDHRAYQAMDLITVVVSENAEGKKEADTTADRDSSFLAGITNFFNFESDAETKNPGLDTGTLVDADFQSEFEGTGETTRKGSLQGRIAAVVVEVLPTGVMRIEGEKIISVNDEEQIMVISGLVRPRDVNSSNEVQSSAIANLRIDYFGRGVIGEVQYVGWFGRVMNALWPF